VDKLIERLRKFRDDRDWAQFHTPKNLAISVTIEAAELLECFQWRSDDARTDKELKGNVESEAADVLLYLVQLCDSLNIDLIQAAHHNVGRNEHRFPVDSSLGVAKPKDREAQ
jgi:NTP pyrophosphatase (non-canonical NTP hydrolase)